MKEQIKYVYDFGRNIATASKEQELEDEQVLISHLYDDKKVYQVIDSSSIISEEQYLAMLKERKEKILKNLDGFCRNNEISLEELKNIIFED